MSLTTMVGPFYVTETKALLAQMTVRPSFARAALIDTTIRALIAGGLWLKLDILYLLAAHAEQAGRLNWKNPGTFTCTAVNSPTFTTDRGFAGNGTTSYLDTNFNPSTNGVNYTRDSASVGAWSRTSGTMAAAGFGWFDGADGITLNPRTTGNASAFRINQAAGSATDTDILSGAGLFASNRSASNATQYYINGAADVVSTAANQASTALNNATIRIGSSSASAFATTEYAAMFSGSSLSASEHAALYTILVTHQQAVGAA